MRRIEGHAWEQKPGSFQSGRHKQEGRTYRNKEKKKKVLRQT